MAPGTCVVSAAAQRDGSVRVEAAWRLTPRYEAALEVAEFANTGVSEARSPRHSAPPLCRGSRRESEGRAAHPRVSE